SESIEDSSSFIYRFDNESLYSYAATVAATAGGDDDYVHDHIEEDDNYVNDDHSSDQGYIPIQNINSNDHSSSPRIPPEVPSHFQEWLLSERNTSQNGLPISSSNSQENRSLPISSSVSSTAISDISS